LCHPSSRLGGAVIKKDSLVMSFVESNGVSDPGTLEGRANVDLVVKFLELRMPDDNVATGRKPPMTDWEPPTIELTASCWIRAKHAGEKKAALVPRDSRALESALIGYGRLRPEIEAAIQAGNKLTQDVFEKYEKQAGAVRAGLTTYKPGMKSGSETIKHVQMAGVIDRFVDAIADVEKKLQPLSP
jgi:hypothetical protein